MCIGLVSCSKNEQEGYGENYNRKYDSQNFSANREQTVTEDGFYTIQEEYIFFVDKKSGKAIPLCGKVNCKHNDSTCNAYFNAPLNIQAYDGKIYVVARGSKDRTESLYCSVVKRVDTFLNTIFRKDRITPAFPCRTPLFHLVYNHQAKSEGV